MSKTKTYKKLQPVQKLIVVNSRLRHGDMSKVAKKTGFSSTLVSSVIKGNSENGKILNAAYDMTRSRKENFQVIRDLTSKKATTPTVD
jgi:predicted transcriptional regulator